MTTNEATSLPCDPDARRRGLLAAIVAISIVGFGISVTFPLFGVLMERMGISGFGVGLSAGVVAFGMLSSGVLMPRLLRRYGMVRLLLYSTVLSALLLLAVGLFENYWYWVALRFLMGFTITALFFGSELWIVSMAPEDRRGAWLGVYGTCLSLGFFVGPMLLNIVGTDGWPPFLSASALILLALIPIWFGRDGAPPQIEEGAFRFRDAFSFFRTDTTLVSAVILFGTVEFGAMGLMSVWGLRSGLSETNAVILLAVFALGNVFLQFPLGLLSDRFSRIALMAICGGAVAFASAVLPIVVSSLWLLYGVVFLAGGLASGLYLLPLAELGKRYSGAQLARANGAVIVCYGIGSLVSPLLLGRAMDAVPPHGLPYALLMVSVCFLGLLAWRQIIRHRS